MDREQRIAIPGMLGHGGAGNESGQLPHAFVEALFGGNATELGGILTTTEQIADILVRSRWRQSRRTITTDDLSHQISGQSVRLEAGLD
jgi:hypothetical protein